MFHDAFNYSYVFYVVQARYRKEQASTQPVPWIPPVDNLLKDSTDGSALGALLHFYCPQLLQLDGEEHAGVCVLVLDLCRVVQQSTRCS